MNDSWHWQEPGTAWRGVGIYHVTLTVTDRQPLLGELIIPDNDPKQAYVKASHLGIALLETARSSWKRSAPLCMYATRW